MELIEKPDQWQLEFKNGLVQLIQVDFRLGFVLSDGKQLAELHIGTRCHLSGVPEGALMIPEETATLAPALRLFNAEVQLIVIERSGDLKVYFSDGRTLAVKPDDRFEAWELGSSIGFRMVCAPDGKVSLFRDKQRPVKH